MKSTSPKQPSQKVPRLNSLLHRLQHAPGQGDESCLDQLMIFLHDPPDDITDRWKAGAEMCAAWGITCSGTSVWRLYCTHTIVWRIRLALEADVDSAEKPEVLEEKAAHMMAARTYEILANPNSSASDLVGLARIEFRKKALEFARQKHADSQRTDLDQAYATFEKKSFMNFEAQFAIDQLKLALNHPKPSPFLKPFLDSLSPPPFPPPPAPSAPQ
jgi:hypothetical protein